jgi:hypothetical protein
MQRLSSDLSMPKADDLRNGELIFELRHRSGPKDLVGDGSRQVEAKPKLAMCRQKILLDNEVAHPLNPQPSTEYKDNSSRNDVGSLKECVHAVWSGWLRIKVTGITSLFKPWQQFWCVLNIERAQLRLDCIIVDPWSGSVRTADSIALDSSNAAALEKPVLACTTDSRLLIKEQGSGKRYRLSCESPQEAEQLLQCVNALLESMR